MTSQLDKALQAVQRTAVAAAEAEEARRRAVVHAKLAGAKWEQIARYLGMPVSVAERRFARAVRDAETKQPTLF